MTWSALLLFALLLSFSRRYTSVTCSFLNWKGRRALISLFSSF